MTMRAIASVATCALLAACARPVSPPVSMANPASVACVQQGGRDEILKTPAGEIGICHLPGGRACEEWALYRDHRCTLPTPPVGR